MKTIRYQKITKMEPREGVKYATSYLKQTLEQRKELTRHIRTVVTEIADAVEGDEELMDFIRTPLKGFKTTTGQNRSITDILTDMVNEGKGKQRNGLPKDFAMAPIERWNKLFADSDYALVLVQTYNRRENMFNSLIEDLADE
jgi:hypothetical protein